jgi:hypothetical protein
MDTLSTFAKGEANRGKPIEGLRLSQGGRYWTRLIFIDGETDKAWRVTTETRHYNLYQGRFYEEDKVVFGVDFLYKGVLTNTRGKMYFHPQTGQWEKYYIRKEERR